MIYRHKYDRNLRCRNCDISKVTANAINSIYCYDQAMANHYRNQFNYATRIVLVCLTGMDVCESY